MSSNEERIAVLESLAKRQNLDISALFTALRDHMDKEDRDRKELMENIAEIKDSQHRQKSFVGGVIFAVSSVWALLLGALAFFKVGHTG